MRAIYWPSQRHDAGMPMEISLLRDLVRAAINVTGADMANLQLLSGGVLRLTASQGFGRDFLDFFAIVRG